jgi:hypothetical protein
MLIYITKPSNIKIFVFTKKQVQKVCCSSKDVNDFIFLNQFPCFFMQYYCPRNHGLTLSILVRTMKFFSNIVFNIFELLSTNCNFLQFQSKW